MLGRYFFQLTTALSCEWRCYTDRTHAPFRNHSAKMLHVRANSVPGLERAGFGWKVFFVNSIHTPLLDHGHLNGPPLCVCPTQLSRPGPGRLISAMPPPWRSFLLFVSGSSWSLRHLPMNSVALVTFWNSLFSAQENVVCGDSS